MTVLSEEKSVSTKTWYLEARDAHTNEVIATEVSAEMTHRSVLCQDGKKRDFWECEYAIITKLLRNQDLAHLRFNVFYREGRYGPVKLWPFAKKKKQTLAHALRKGIVRPAIA